MKLSTIAVSVAVILGASVVGGSWYTGKQIESQYQQWVDIGNTELKKLDIYGIQAEIKNIRVERHFFSSDVQYDLAVKGIEGNAEVYTFKGNDKVQHGPFPINRLTSLKFSPIMASVKNQIIAPEAFRSYLKQDELLSGNTDLSYSGDTNGQFVINTIESVGEKEDSSFKIDKINLNFDLNRLQEGKVEIITPKITIKDSDALVDFEGVKFTQDTKKNAKYTYLNEEDYRLEMDKLTFTYFEDAGTFVMNDLKYNSDQKFVENGKLAVTSDLLSKIALIQGDKKAELGKFKFDFDAELDALLTDQFVAFLYQNYKNMDKMPQKEVEEHYLKLLQSEPKFNFKEISLENSQGKTDLSLDIALNKFDPKMLNHLENIVSIFNKLKVKAKLNIPFTKEFIAEVSKFDPNVPQSPEEMVDELVILAKQQSPYLTVDDKNIGFNLETKDGDVFINEKLIPKKEVNAALMMILFSLAVH
ncbi:uncharacterized protein YdgA (DUF945 family) [Bisgaardia hudsonensis]|uniref:Uncharacterized protein YdgA (DUF945 family) n=1 Tax=Bisgaardia hudsonensis TaxID=109472 RepID=A0A4V2SJE2_9PAST|nr:DUF945 family protein [Bisgaardia hudsonensis]QLB12850.1 hypothetical protein A6A11_04125 [Bisgaardia hudsonensis]TCP14410.1 uncharacterized protein YdgA (DUF945 family) [Bisgaardia hudsonensis]